MRSLAYNPAFALNAICPYFTMFPLEYPLRVLRHHRHQEPVVMDPFCGRGTTLFAARVLGYESYGVDVSPVAVAIAKAKLCNATADEALALAKLILASVRPTKIPRTEFFAAAYHPVVLRDLCALRESLLENVECDASVLLRAAVLGCLHGPRNKGSASYLSNQMPRTFAPKPDYAISYWRKRRMKPPKVDVLKVIEKKLRLIAASRELERSSFRKVACGDATKRKALPTKRRFSVVVTSPPYYGMTTYVQDQWIRNWFMGGAAKIDYDAGVQLHHTGQDAFAESLGKVWANMATSEAESLDLYVRFGVIPSSKTDPRKLMRDSLESSGAPFRVISCRNADSADSGKRQAHQMGADSGACDEYDFHFIRT